MKQLLGLVMLGAMTAATGCAGFFSDPNATTSTSGSTTGDYVYVVNQTTDTIAGFAIGTSTLTATSGSPYALTSGLTPTSAVVDRQDGLVYVGGNGAIQCFSIGTSGALTAVSGGGTTTSGDVESMATSPDGQWLLALSYYATLGSAQVTVYGINTSTGVLTQQGQALTVTFSSTIGTVSPNTIRIAPSGLYVAASLGAAGDAFFTFTTATGGLSQVANVKPSVDTSGNILSDNALNFSTNSNYLFIGTTGSTSGGSFIQVYPISSSGTLGTQATIASGDSPASLEVDATGTYLYSANRGTANISGYTLSTSGTLAALSSSPFGASAGIGALVRDKSGDYIIGVASTNGTSGTNDVTLYGFDAYTGGRLDEVAVAASGTDPAGSVAVAATH